MKIVAKGIMNRGVVGTNRAISTFPKVTVLNGGTLLAAYKVGPTKDSEKADIELRWSDDLGETWTEPTTPFSSMIDGKRGSLWMACPSQLSSRLLMTALWVDRESYPGKPLFHPETEGCLPMSILLAESGDDGHTWSPWKVVPLPSELGPPSLTSPLLQLASGRMALSIETNKTYLDTSRWYQRVVYIYSEDEGETWSAPFTVSEDPTGRMYNWDQRAGVAPDGRIVTFTWYFDSQTDTYRNIQRRISPDEGRTWTAPEDLGIKDQAGRPSMLPDGRIVIPWVDRFGTQSIRARLAQTIDGPFLSETEVILYDHAATIRRYPSSAGPMGGALEDMTRWTYGLPFSVVLPNDDILIVYYSGITERMDVEWGRLSC